MNGSIVFFSSNQAELYRAASLCGIPCLSDASQHEDVPSPPEWIYEKGSPEYLIEDKRRKDSLYHENANCIVYDIDDKSLYFENQVKLKPGYYRETEFVSSMYVANSISDFVKMFKSQI